MKDLISVIIPAYNVGLYIGKCLDSVVSQSYSNLEIIVVNDGATDDTPAIIETYLGDPRIRYIVQENGGVSAARNAGIEAASGQYLTFVDSDDYLEPDMYEKLYAAIQASQADMAVCDYNLVYDDHAELCYSSTRDENIDIAADTAAYFYRNCACPRPNNYIWTRLYRTDMVKSSGIRFQKYRLGDDTLFNFMLLPHISKVANIAGGFYNYYQRSVSNVYTVAKRSNLAEVYAATFEALITYYDALGFRPDFLPIHAYTRLRSVVFYSRLAGMSDDDIAGHIESGFQGKKILEYLGDLSPVARYVAENGFSDEYAARMWRIMKTAVDNPRELTDLEFPN